MVLEHQVTLRNDTVVMLVLLVLFLNLPSDFHVVCRVWISSTNAAKVASHGFRIVHAPSDYFYLVCNFESKFYQVGSHILKDCGGGDWLVADPIGQVLSLGSTFYLNFHCVRNSWCDPFKTWQKVSLFR